MKVLVCDDNPHRFEYFRPFLWIGHTVVCANTIERSLDLLNQSWDIVSLDHDFRGSQDDSEAEETLTGRVLARRITEFTEKPDLVVIHSMNVRGGDAMMKLLLDADVKVLRDPLPNIFLQ